MNKIKNFFFNKVEKGKSTNFIDLINSFLLGGLKIFILFFINAIIGSLFASNDYNNSSFLIVAAISSLITLSILVYILVNRLPNQFKIFRNYFNTNKNKNSKISNNMVNEKISKSENLNIEAFKNKIFFKNGQKKKHYTLTELKVKGKLYTNDLIWYEGLKDWTRVIDIPELSSIALGQPPLTLMEKNIFYLRKSLKPSILIYLIFSLILGITAGLLEKYQYDIFFEEVNANSIKYQKEDDALEAKNKSYYGAYQSYDDNSKPTFSGFSNIRQDEAYATRSDGSKFTRWSIFLAQRGVDQEQLSYEATHKFLFRPYKAIIKHANLSREERGNIGLLLTNFTISALVTNLFLLTLLILVYFLKNKSKGS